MFVKDAGGYEAAPEPFWLKPFWLKPFWLKSGPQLERRTRQAMALWIGPHPRLMLSEAFGAWSRQRMDLRLEQERMRQATALMIGGQCKLAFSQAFGAESGPLLERTRQAMALLIGCFRRRLALDLGSARLYSLSGSGCDRLWR